MEQTLRTDQLLKTVGIPVENDQGKPMGKIVEVARNEERNNIEYVILKCDAFMDGKDRFFAIPASTALIKITQGGKIILQAAKKDLKEVNRISLEKCPRPNFRVKPMIFELHQYQAPEQVPADSTNRITPIHK